MAVRIGRTPSEPVELQLPHGVTMTVRLLQPEGEARAMQAYRRVMAEREDEGVALLEEAIVLGAHVIESWSGVLDAEGRELPPTEENVRSLFLMLPLLAFAFRGAYSEAKIAWVQEGNG